MACSWQRKPKDIFEVYKEGGRQQRRYKCSGPEQAPIARDPIAEGKEEQGKSRDKKPGERGVKYAIGVAKKEESVNRGEQGFGLILRKSLAIRSEEHTS